jgi:hypothetical protein
LPQDFKEFYENIDADITHEDYVKAKTTVDKYVEQKEKDTDKPTTVANKSAQPFHVSN